MFFLQKFLKKYKNIQKDTIVGRCLRAGGSYLGGKDLPIIFLSFPTLKTIKNH